MFTTTDNEAQVINEVRQIFRAKMPESDPWKMPSFVGIANIVLGGAIWTVLNEARNNVDARMNPVTAVGEDLDRIGATPPLNLIRLDPTTASGFIRGRDLTVGIVTAGTTFETLDGNTYTVTANTTVVGGGVILPVQSITEGSAFNSPIDQPMTTDLDGVFYSNGIEGGFDRECDDDFRRRIFSGFTATAFLGSPCSYTQMVNAVRGVSRSWAILDGGVPTVMFAMEDAYIDGVPTTADIEQIKEGFSSTCKTSIFYCANFKGIKSLTIAPEICWENPPEDICEINDALTAWLRNSFDLGEGVTGAQIQCFFDQNFPQYGAQVKCVDGYAGVCDAVYNMAEIIGPC